MKKRKILNLCLLMQAISIGCTAERSDVSVEPAKVDRPDSNYPAAGLYDNASESPLIELIDAAQKSIDIEIYEMRQADVHAALQRAVVDRSVQIRIVIEPRAVGGCQLAPLFGESTADFSVVAGTEAVSETEMAAPASNDCEGYIKSLKKLMNSGVAIRPFLKTLCGGDSERCVQHGKMVLVDGKSALISTGNFNNSSLCSVSDDSSRCNRDYSVIIDEKASLNVLNKVFSADFAGRPAKMDQILSDNPGHQLTISPYAHDTILKLVRSAKSSIALQAQYLKEPELNEELARAALRGVKVQATLASACSFARIDDAGADKLREILSPMLDAGVDIKMFTKRNRIGGKPAYLHSKSFVIDGKRAWIGSINGSTQSFTQNREFGVISDEAHLVAKLSRIMQSDHESSKNHSVEENLNCEAAMADEFTVSEIEPR